MTVDQLRNERNKFAGRVTNLIREFEKQTGVPVQAINIERAVHKYGGPGERKTLSLLKGVYVALDMESDTNPR